MEEKNYSINIIDVYSSLLNLNHDSVPEIKSNNVKIINLIYTTGIGLLTTSMVCLLVNYSVYLHIKQLFYRDKLHKETALPFGILSQFADPHPIIVFSLS